MDAKRAIKLLKHESALTCIDDLSEALVLAIAALKAQGDAVRWELNTPRISYPLTFNNESTAMDAQHNYSGEITPLYAAPQPAEPQSYEIQCNPVAVSDCDEATSVVLRVGNQQFAIGDYLDTKEEAEAFAGFLRTALQSIVQPAECFE